MKESIRYSNVFIIMKNKLILVKVKIGDLRGTGFLDTGASCSKMNYFCFLRFEDIHPEARMFKVVAAEGTKIKSVDESELKGNGKMKACENVGEDRVVIINICKINFCPCGCILDQNFLELEEQNVNYKSKAISLKSGDKVMKCETVKINENNRHINQNLKKRIRRTISYKMYQQRWTKKTKSGIKTK